MLSMEKNHPRKNCLLLRIPMVVVQRARVNGNGGERGSNAGTKQHGKVTNTGSLTDDALECDVTLDERKKRRC
jgi:hypothetical protein